jgi:Protein of unknown function (DUF3176)
LNECWLWEVLTIIVSVICMAAIITILLAYHRRPVQSLPSGITLNAIVSFLATVSKAAMLVSVASCISQLKWHWFDQRRRLADFGMFDECSRGPWGSFLFLLRKNLPLLAAFGAVITIIAIGLDPFIQQIISYPTRKSPGGSTTIATVARAQKFDMGLEPNSGVQAGPDFGMKAAIYRGIFAPQPRTEVVPVCTTGNCTFPLFDSLAMSSKCLNVTDQTTPVNHTSSVNHNVNQPGLHVRNFTYNLPGNYTMKVTAYYADNDLTKGIAMKSDAGMPESMARSQLGIPNPVTSLGLLQFPEFDAEGYDGDYLTQTPQAWQCALYFSLNTYNVSVTNGNSSINITDSWHEDPSAPKNPVEWAPQDESDCTMTYTRLANSGVRGGNSTFLIPGGTVAGLAQYLNHTLSGSHLSRTAEVGTFDDPEAWPNDVMAALNTTVDIADIMDGLATSMTTYIRELDNGGIDDEPFQQGATLITETYVHLRWAWIALPLALVLSSAVLLSVTIAKASRDKLPIWKTSALAALFHGLEAENNAAGGMLSRGVGVSSVAQMDAVASSSMYNFLREMRAGSWSCWMRTRGAGTTMRTQESNRFFITIYLCTIRAYFLFRQASTPSVKPDLAQKRHPSS